MTALRMQPEALVIEEMDAENPILDTGGWLTGDNDCRLLLRINLCSEDGGRYVRQCG